MTNKKDTVLSITEAREQLTRLPDQLARSHETVAITRRNQPVLAVLAWDLYEAIMETLDVMGQPEMMAALRTSAQDIAAGRTISLDDISRELAEGPVLSGARNGRAIHLAGRDHRDGC